VAEILYKIEIHCSPPSALSRLDHRIQKTYQTTFLSSTLTNHIEFEMATNMTNNSSVLLNDPNSQVSDPLYRRYQVMEGSVRVTKYLIAYPAVTIQPAIPNGTPLTPYPGTVVINLAENPTDADKVEIHAEDIYFYLGSHFLFQSKDVTIVANRIFAVPNSQAQPGAAPNEIQIDCSGPSRDGSRVAPPQARSNAQGLLHYIWSGTVPYFASGGISGEWAPDRSDDPDPNGHWENPMSPPPSGGAAGQNGQKGEVGTNGGNICIVGTLCTVTENTDPNNPWKLYLNTTQGIGNPGYSGQKGGNGGDVYLPNLLDFLGNCFLECPAPWTDGNMWGDNFTKRFEEVLHNHTQHDSPGGVSFGQYLMQATAEFPSGAGGDAGEPGRAGEIKSFVSSDLKGFIVEVGRTAKGTTLGGVGAGVANTGRVWADWPPVRDWDLNNLTIGPVGNVMGDQVFILPPHAPRSKPGPKGKNVDWAVGIPSNLQTGPEPAGLRNPVHLLMGKYSWYMKKAGDQANDPYSHPAKDVRVPYEVRESRNCWRRTEDTEWSGFPKIFRLAFECRQ
jgi:hypothetical protein